MNEELLRYYLEEMSYLREAGGLFGDRHRNVASQLRLSANNCDDPHVERLLEGFAFLAARIRAKLDDEFPQITDAFFSILYPHVQRPLPSAAIVQFGKRPGQGRVPPPGGDVIPAETRLGAVQQEFRDCKFRTIYPVALWPMEVVDAQIFTDRLPVADSRPGDSALLSLKIRCDAPGGLGKLMGFDRLRFHLAGEDRIAFALHELLGSAVNRVELSGKIDGGRERRVELTGPVIELVGFGPDEGLFPYPPQSPRGYRLIQELFHFPSKFFFIDIRGLDAVKELGSATEFRLSIFLGRAPRERLPIGPENFLLGCAPVVNLFKIRAAPIRLTRTQTEYAVIPEIPIRDHAEVYSIDEVTSSRLVLSKDRVIPPLYAVQRGVDDQGGRAETCWFAQRRPSPRTGDNGTDMTLSFSSPALDHNAPGDEIVTVSLTCTNRDRPPQMRFGQPNGDLQPDDPVPSGMIHFLREPCPTVRPPLGGQAHWRLISNLSLNHLSLVDTSDEDEGEGDRRNRRGGTGRDALVGLLDAYNFDDDQRIAAQIGAIVSVTSRRLPGYTPRRVVVGGIEVVVTLDAAPFAGTSPFLLACVLERFFGLHVSINSFCQTVARTTDGKVLKKWPPRIGERTLL